MQRSRPPILAATSQLTNLTVPAAVLDKVVTVLRSVVNRGLSCDGNATAVETLVQSDAESGSIHVLVLITVDLFVGWMDRHRAELQDVLPTGSKVRQMGGYDTFDRSRRGSDV